MDLLGIGDRVTGGDGPATAQQIIDDFEGGIEAFLDPSKRAKGIPTGFHKLDQMTGGLREDELFILAARPSMGKSALLANIAYHVAVRLQKVAALFSL